MSYIGTNAQDPNYFANEPTSIELEGGTYNTDRLYRSSTAAVTGDITLTNNLVLARITDKGNNVTLTSDGTTRTITGSGKIESGNIVTTNPGNFTGMTGTIGDTVSYPVGHPVQTVIINPDDGQGTIASASFVEWSGSNLRLTMTPRSATNLLLVEATFLFGGNNTSNLTHFQFSTVVGTTFTALPVGSAGGSRTHAHGSTRQKEHNADDCNIVHIATSYTAGAGERTFAIRAKNESGTGTKYFNATSHTGAEVAYVKPLFKVTEIQV